ncbi:MAG: hypothetical protein IPM92_13910 [Saprospiraceae bacterium]|nr:hypothetical protein [Saprospiraceae bacterium]
MSKSGQEHWLDSLFKKSLDHFELKPSDAVWENIAKHLDGEKRRPFLLGNWLNWLWALIFVAVVLGIVAFLWFNEKKQDPKPSKHPMDLPYRNSGSEDKGTAQLFNSQSAVSSERPAHEIKAIPVSYVEEMNNNIAAEFNSKNQQSLTEASKNPNFTKEKEISLIPENKFSASAANIEETLGSEVNKEELNNLIASTDPMFMANAPNELSFTETNKIPSKQNYLQTKTRKLDFSKLAEGCNVYYDNKAHFFVDAYYAPELAKRSFSVSDPAMLNYAEKRANTEKPILSYTAGLRGSVVFSNGLAFRTGLQYSNNSERFDYVKETLTITYERKDKDGNVIGIETKEIDIMDQSYNHFRSIDIPFILGYEKDLKDFILSVNGGIGFNLFTKHSGKIYKEDQKAIYNLSSPGEGSDQIYKTKAGLSFITSVGLNYKYNERIMLMLEPSARLYFNSITEDSYPIQQKYVFFGLNVGLRYRVF